MGVWIETIILLWGDCGAVVTPYMGVWIETSHCFIDSFMVERHTLYGCVD